MIIKRFLYLFLVLAIAAMTPVIATGQSDEVMWEEESGGEAPDADYDALKEGHEEGLLEDQSNVIGDEDSIEKEALEAEHEVVAEDADQDGTKSTEYYGAGLPLEMLPDMFEINLTKGYLTFSIPLDEGLYVAYSGDVLNEMIDRKKSGCYGTCSSGVYKPQASWVGLGWSLGTIPMIAREIPSYCNPGTTNPSWKCSMNFGSYSGDLKYYNNDGVSRWHTKKESFLHIGYNDSGNSWTVRTTDGTEYTFGTSDASRAAGVCCRRPYTWECGDATAQWLCDKITDRNGNWMEFSYSKKNITSSEPLTRTYTQATYLTEIRSYRKNGAGPYKKVTFSRSGRSDYPTGSWGGCDEWYTYAGTKYPHFYKKDKLDAVRIYYNGEATPQQTYEFSYYPQSESIRGYFGRSKKFLTLKSITVKGKNGTVFRTVDFTYDLRFGYLTKVKKGMGGEIELQYNPYSLHGYKYFTVAAKIARDGMGNEIATCYQYSDPSYGPASSDKLNGFETVKAGVSKGVTVHHFSYTDDKDDALFGVEEETEVYSSPDDITITSTDVWQMDDQTYGMSHPTGSYSDWCECYDWMYDEYYDEKQPKFMVSFTKPGAEKMRVHFWGFEGYSGSGTEWVRLYATGPPYYKCCYSNPYGFASYQCDRGDFTSAAANGDRIDVAGAFSRCAYGQCGTVGRTYGVEIDYIEFYPGDEPVDIYTHGMTAGSLYSRAVTSYYDTIPDADIYGESGKTVRLVKRVDAYVFDGDADFEQTGVEYEYDYYGNAIRVSNLGDVSFTGDELYAYTEYINDDGASWILGVPNHSYTKASDDATIVAETWIYYSDTYNGTVDYGTGNKFFRRTERAAVFGHRGNAANPVVEMSYDQWGNVVSTINALGVTTVTTEYDPTFHMFPVSSTNTLGHTSYTYFYGVNGDGDPGFTGSGLFGQDKSIKDINGKFVRTTYDEFGRTVAAWGENFSETHPATSYEYTLWQDPIHPNKVVTRTRKEVGGSETFDTFSYYDGLGRTIQTQTPSEEAGKMMVSGPVDYNSRGMVRKQYIGYEVSGDGTFIPAPFMMKPTEFTYDTMGRVVRNDMPDGTFTRAFFDDFVTIATDANGRQVRSTTDAYGRVVTKDLFEGFYPTATVYTVTAFKYDLLGRLIQTTANENGPMETQTVYVYDNLGRRTDMHDPDMGHWSYQYDKLGRMTSQTDAKALTTMFYYDVLSRLIKKTYSDGSFVQYYYDTAPGYTGTNSKGRLVRVKKEGQ